MFSTAYLLILASLALSVFGQSYGYPPRPQYKDVSSPSFHQQYVTKWLKFWDGDTSLLDQLVAPDMTMYTDRIPSPTGNGSQFYPVTSSKTFLQVFEETFSVYSSHSFQLRAWTGSGHMLAVRWTLNGVLNNNTKRAGAQTSLNGTDFIFLDGCTGLLKEYDLAADSINRYHEYGYTEISV